MASMTKAQLLDELAKLRHNYELLEQKCIDIAGSMSAISVQRDVAEARAADFEAQLRNLVLPRRVHTPVVRTGTRPVYEFNPALPGDFTRASQLARQHGGSVRRAREGA